MTSQYCIKEGYQSRSKPCYYSDTPPPGGRKIVWQPEVYELAATFGRHLKLTHVLDIGCGAAEKLSKLHPEFRIVGVDYGANLDHCRLTYPHGQWIEADFERATTLPLDPEIVRNCVIVCSDVVEHLIEPGALMRLIGKLLGEAPVALISTPDRNLRGSGCLDWGPPENQHHVREWTLDEFEQFARVTGLRPIYNDLTVTNDLRHQRNTILCIAGGKNLPAGALSSVLPPRTSRLLYLLRTARKGFGAWRERFFRRSDKVEAPAVEE